MNRRMLEFYIETLIKMKREGVTFNIYFHTDELTVNRDREIYFYIM